MKEVKAIIRRERVDAVVRGLRAAGVTRLWASTGHRGDGVIAVTRLERLVSVRTGDEELLAIL